MQSSYNPDVLSCLANLSSDEVFTPPKLANEILDLLPKEIWKDKNATFLDPVCKTGVFLREIARRLLEGLKDEIPDVQKRIDHIYSKQLFGVGITELTSLLSRRSLYCSKSANGKYSISSTFNDEQGNVFFHRTDHDWKNGRCAYCGVSQLEYDREEGLETHAYQFIHNKLPSTIKNMRFDVIIGNPPYQLGSEGGTRDIPIYNKFVEQAKKLSPRFMTMIIPSRWMASGLGLAEFREKMLADKHIRKMIDYPVASEVFPGVQIKGGVCYFLWEKNTVGDCEVVTIRNNDVIGPITRNLAEYDIFVRDSRATSILKKILNTKELSITKILSVDKEFGWTSNFSDFHEMKKPGDVEIYYIKKGKRDSGWIERNKIVKSKQLVDKWKVMIPKAGSDGGEKIPDSVLGKPLIAGSPSVCTQSYLFFYVDTEREAKSIVGYLRTRFFRFLVSLRKITQDATRSTYSWVPQQDWNHSWDDKGLYRKYRLTKEEIEFIESMIRPM